MRWRARRRRPRCNGSHDSLDATTTAIHGLRDRLQEGSFITNIVFNLTDDLLDDRLLGERLPAQDAPHVERGEARVDALLEQHGGDAQDALALGWHLPPMEPQNGDVLLRVQ
uniref:Uncharacterized protein n=1 Tax=Oryza glumipatula TaxID=40148 RepID=A0A0E0A3J9_9ORYZ